MGTKKKKSNLFPSKKKRKKQKKQFNMYGMGAPPPMSKRMFNKYDSDNSGTISLKEFRSLVYDLGHALTDVEFDLAVKMIDSDGDGELSYDEFKKWWSSQDRFGDLKLSEEQLGIITQAVT